MASRSRAARSATQGDMPCLRRMSSRPLGGRVRPCATSSITLADSFSDPRERAMFEQAMYASASCPRPQPFLDSEAPRGAACLSSSGSRRNGGLKVVSDWMSLVMSTYAISYEAPFLGAIIIHHPCKWEAVRCGKISLPCHFSLSTGKF